MKMLVYEAHKWSNNYIIGLLKHNTMLVNVRQTKKKTEGLEESVQAYNHSVLLKTCDCDCVNPEVPYRPCLVSVKRAGGSTQGLSSGHLTGSQIRGAQLAPHAWMAHDPGGRDPCLGHVRSCDPLTNWWEGDSHVLVHKAASTSPSNSSSSVGIVIV